ncbi:MAG: 5-(carboxyamino)imidazole ribonucleotide synthase [Defluviitaleaceae bacterium]|nr:5-(carboxyamino)imidazole ribonucleotide synthase [Defluviitaleaceae bacterium]
MKKIFPYQQIGIIGGGQLGRMMCIAAKAMGYRVAVLDPTPNCPCGQVADVEITAEYNDLSAIKKLAEISDVITYEFENIDIDALSWLKENAYLPQGSEVLKITRHRYLEKSTISAMDIPVADFARAKRGVGTGDMCPLRHIPSQPDTVCGADFARAKRGVGTGDMCSPRHIPSQPDTAYAPVFREIPLENMTVPCVIKTTTGGYDGKGQIVLRSEADMPAARELAAAHECIVEKFMPFSKEISVIVARSTTGEVSTFPVAENIHVNNILHQSIVPARISPELEREAIECAKKIAANLGAVGVIGIEMFVVDDKIVVNELAPRPHNSGHYTIDACVTSQFEQHVRAICGLPLGDPSLHTPAVMVNILGDHLNCTDLSDLAPYLPLLPNGKLHLYGKAEGKTGRKMGHISMLGDVEETLAAVGATGIWT